MLYQQTIHRIAPDLNPAGVEANMRTQYGTLDHLSHSIFEEEAEIARACERAEPGYLREAAESYGMKDEFERWETQQEQEDMAKRPGRLHTDRQE